MRLIDADKIVEVAEHAYGEWNKAMGAADGRQINRRYKMQELCKAVKGVADGCPTIDPESLRPTAHIMRGTVPDTHDDAFCSNCRSYLGVPGVDYEDYDSVLNHRYKYCPYCGARYVK
jgi:hypothetical protein